MNANAGDYHSETDETSASFTPSQEESDIKQFMKSYVSMLFENGNCLTLEQKSRFGTYVRTELGQTWFSKMVNSQRIRSRCVSETTFYSLIQHFAIVLFECTNSDHFSPAKTLMNMCFTFYREVQVPGCEPFKEYLSSHLTNQRIWRSLRFWNAAFFDSLQCACIQIPLKTQKGILENDLQEEEQYLENVTFGQLGTFICNMHAFGLNRNLCEEFLNKQCEIAGFPKDKTNMLWKLLDGLHERVDLSLDAM